METVIGVLLGGIPLAVWVYLLALRGGFWRADQGLEKAAGGAFDGFEWPAVDVVVPARNEAEVLPRTLSALLRQEYPGRLRIFLVDDHSADGTAGVAVGAALSTGNEDRLNVIRARDLPRGWTGKGWALQEGVQAAQGPPAEFLLLTDADILHPPGSVRALAGKARQDRLDLVSLMVELRAKTLWERLLIPAFVYFFAMIYPFRWVNDPARKTAAAAGGCVLLRKSALDRAGGLASIAAELIDDCALARLVKARGRPGGGRIWLGLASQVRSVRAYDSLGAIWRMVARTAFTQLNHSFPLLVGTVVGLLLVFVAPPVSAVGGLIGGWLGLEPALGGWLGMTGLAAWALMTASYVPTLRRYRLSVAFGPLLPAIAMLYTLMTVDSALRALQGKGGSWKGRTYNPAR